MRIIDSEGRVFGLINAIDLGAVLLLLLLGIGIFTALRQENVPPTPTDTTRQVTLTLQLRYPELAPMIAIGDREVWANTSMATITNMTTDGQGSMAKVWVSVMLNAEEKSGVYTYQNRFGTQYLKAGDTLSLDLPKSRIDGLIISLATA